MHAIAKAMIRFVQEQAEVQAARRYQRRLKAIQFIGGARSTWHTRDVHPRFLPAFSARIGEERVQEMVPSSPLVRRESRFPQPPPPDRLVAMMAKAAARTGQVVIEDGVAAARFGSSQIGGAARQGACCTPAPPPLA